MTETATIDRPAAADKPLDVFEHAAVGRLLAAFRSQLCNLTSTVAPRYEQTDAGWRERAVATIRSVDQLREAMEVQARHDLGDDHPGTLYPQELA